MKHHKKNSLRLRQRLNGRLGMLVFAGVFVLVGGILLARSMAAPQPSSLQAADSSTVANPGGHKSEAAPKKTVDPAKSGASTASAAPATPGAAAKPSAGPAAGQPSQAPVAAPKTISPIPKPAAVQPPATGNSRMVKMTFYGAYDNDPPGSRAIAHPVIHQLAGGTGSYTDPLTFASPSGAGEYAWGQIIYVPRLQKYFIREDSCGVSWTAPIGCGGVDMVDLYVGNPSGSANVIACEEALTPDGTAEIILSPASDLAYDATPLWNEATGTCAHPH